jgi:hypothetical protein
MALDATKLFKIGGAEPALFIYYGAADTAATMQASGYFNTVTDQLHKGDVIIMIGNAYATIDMAFVNSTSGAATVTTIGVEGITAT